jgi:hypothetical protein
LRLAAALAWFWYLRGSWSLARESLEAVLAHADQRGPAHPSLRARVLNALAFLAECQSDEARALAAARESETLCRAAGDAENLAYSLANQGEVLVWQGDPKSAEPPLDECLRLFRGLNPPGTWGLALSLKHLSASSPCSSPAPWFSLGWTDTASRCRTLFALTLFRGANWQKHRFKQDSLAKIGGRPVEPRG